MKYYFLYVFASVDPYVHGPFDAEEERDAKAPFSGTPMNGLF